MPRNRNHQQIDGVDIMNYKHWTLLPSAPVRKNYRHQQHVAEFFAQII